MRRYTKAFTLIELLVVVSIISMLSSVILVALQSARDKGKVGASMRFASYNYHKLGSDMIFYANFNEASGAPLDQMQNFTASGAVSRGSSFTSGSSLDAQSQSPRLSFTRGSFLTVTNTSYGFSLWFNRAAAPAYTSPYEYLFVLDNDGGGRQIYTNGSATTCWQNVGVSVANNLIYDGKWHHMFCNFDRTSGLLTLFIDGKSVGSIAVTNNSVNFQKIGIGSGLDNNYTFNGLVDEVQIFTESLTARQIQDIYAAGRIKYPLALQ